VHPRTLYGDHRTPLGLEPGTHGQDVTGHGAKGAHLFLALPLAVAGHQAYFDVLLMDIHTSTDLMQHLHTGSPSVSTCDLALNARAAAHQLQGQVSSACSPGGGDKWWCCSIPDDYAATCSRQHTPGPPHFHGSW